MEHAYPKTGTKNWCDAQEILQQATEPKVLGMQLRQNPDFYHWAWERDLPVGCCRHTLIGPYFSPTAPPFCFWNWMYRNVLAKKASAAESGVVVSLCISVVISSIRLWIAATLIWGFPFSKKYKYLTMRNATNKKTRPTQQEFFRRNTGTGYLGFLWSGFHGML